MTNQLQDAIDGIQVVPETPEVIYEIAPPPASPEVIMRAKARSRRISVAVSGGLGHHLSRPPAKMARMQKTPAQIAVLLICGGVLPTRRFSGLSLAERIRRGHDMLVELAGVDHGYDLAAWHRHLRASRQGGYTYGRNIALPRIMQQAMDSPEWQAAVEQLATSTK